MKNFTEMIYSNEYADYILPYSNAEILSTYAEFGAQFLDSHYFLLHDMRSNPSFPLKNTYDLYDESLFMPKLFIPLSTVSLEEAGIIKAQTQPLLNLTGRGTIIGFIDSGIDYTHPAFRTASGQSRILAIWDQTIIPSSAASDPRFSVTNDLNTAQLQSDQIMNPYHYGTMYTQNEINEALLSPNPISILPTIDETGHGTSLAGIACGTPSPENDFTGAAYEAELCVVKLKPAKAYLRQYHFAQEEAVLYQENDIMMGIHFLTEYAQKEKKPLIICIGLGTNQGDHAGNSPISKMITDVSYDTYTIFAIGTGNEGNKAHHYYHAFLSPASNPAIFGDYSFDNTANPLALAENSMDEVELIVPASSQGFTAELWGSTNALFSIGLQSPIGTLIAPVSASPGKNERISFVLEKTKIQMTFSIVPESGGSPLVYFRFEDPIEGNWIIRIYNRTTQNVSFHMWLPASGILSSDISFLEPSPDTTLTIPSDADNAITTGSYNAYTNGLVTETGRGFTSDNSIKPNIISPGINLTAPAINSAAYKSFSGSSAACALLAGGISQLQQWRLDDDIPSIINANSMNAYITRGATRDSTMNYPNPISGYGKLNIYNVFQTLMS